jgi:hypothetical protein
MPDNTTDAKLIEALDRVANIGNMMHALTENVIRLNVTLKTLTESLSALTERLDKQS